MILSLIQCVNACERGFLTTITESHTFTPLAHSFHFEFRCANLYLSVKNIANAFLPLCKCSVRWVMPGWTSSPLKFKYKYQTAFNSGCFAHTCVGTWEWERGAKWRMMRWMGKVCVWMSVSKWNGVRKQWRQKSQKFMGFAWLQLSTAFTYYNWADFHKTYFDRTLFSNLHIYFPFVSALHRGTVTILSFSFYFYFCFHLFTFRSRDFTAAIAKLLTFHFVLYFVFLTQITMLWHGSEASPFYQLAVWKSRPIHVCISLMDIHCKLKMPFHRMPATMFAKLQHLNHAKSLIRLKFWVS